MLSSPVNERQAQPGNDAQSRQTGWRCDLCQSARCELVGTRDRRGGPLATCVCRECGLVSHARIPSQRELDDFYRRHYRRELHGRPHPSAYQVLRDWRRSEAIVKALVPFLEPGDEILDVGAGTGCFTKQLELLGFRTRGLEPSPWYARFARDQMRARVLNTTLDSVTGESAYDVVLMIHVLEHLRSPTATLGRIHGWLRPGGRLVVDVPNLGTPHASRARLFHFPHVFNFTHVTLESLARRCGFEPVQRLTGPCDPNLRVVLRKTDVPSMTTPANGYGVTMDSLRRSHPVRYYSRWTYFRERVTGALGRMRDRVAAPRRLQCLIRRLDGTTISRTGVRTAPAMSETQNLESGLDECAFS